MFSLCFYEVTGIGKLVKVWRNQKPVETLAYWLMLPQHFFFSQNFTHVHENAIETGKMISIFKSLVLQFQTQASLLKLKCYNLLDQNLLNTAAADCSIVRVDLYMVYIQLYMSSGPIRLPVLVLLLTQNNLSQCSKKRKTLVTVQ